MRKLTDISIHGSSPRATHRITGRATAVSAAAGGQDCSMTAVPDRRTDLPAVIQMAADSVSTAAERVARMVGLLGEARSAFGVQQPKAETCALVSDSTLAGSIDQLGHQLMLLEDLVTGFTS
jgi:hypothetical protein